MNTENAVVLWSQPIIAGRTVQNELRNGMGTLLVANLSKRSIVVNYEFYDRNGSISSEGQSTVTPGHIDVCNNMNAGDESRKYMYCKLWFNGSRQEISASLIMSMVEGPAGSETETPVYSVELR
jgi:hypothetical protein